jgi:hypothetical protein
MSPTRDATLETAVREAVTVLESVRADVLLGDVGRLSPQGILNLQAALNTLQAVLPTESSRPVDLGDDPDGDIEGADYPPFPAGHLCGLPAPGGPCTFRPGHAGGHGCGP